MSPTNIFAILAIMMSSVVSIALASDPDALQDLCVAFPSSGVKVNGYACKEEANVTADDFFYGGLPNPGVINDTMGSVVTAANVEKIPGLNTLGLSLSRIDLKAGGLNPPHTHPRATEIVFVLEGEVDVGFVSTGNKLISKTLKEGEIFVFPKGLVHFQKNKGENPAAVISAFDSQLPGTFSVAAVLFSSTPTVPDDVLVRKLVEKKS
ncbi:germin-like protein subfamily 2 member 2 [Cajanus cajan]|uniref:Germin-like protein n=1 Tax=Cajanus cajan TaxID=3821 RepID=A0A151TXA1_CAJCA|nr:germin-like protein subfamily 2 member 2 [Cajanus cajan]KYP71709.1 Germin-like protein subfamily 2 member 2 [Cajanus cajan]